MENTKLRREIEGVRQENQELNQKLLVEQERFDELIGKNENNDSELRVNSQIRERPSYKERGISQAKSDDLTRKSRSESQNLSVKNPQRKSQVNEVKRLLRHELPIGDKLSYILNIVQKLYYEADYGERNIQNLNEMIWEKDQQLKQLSE